MFVCFVVVAESSFFFHSVLFHSEFSEENVNFWKECEDYKLQQAENQPEAAAALIETFVINGAQNELNIKVIRFFLGRIC